MAIAVSRRRPWLRRGGMLLLGYCFMHMAAAHDAGQLRVEAGINLFPSFLAADLDLERKADADGVVNLLLLYSRYPGEAQRIAPVLERIGSIRNLPIRIQASDLDSLESREAQPIAGIFIVEHLDEGELARALRLGSRHQAILVSPHEGDVEQGATGGVFVSDRLLPHVNMRALENQGIRLKPFFLRIAEKYVD